MKAFGNILINKEISVSKIIKKIKHFISSLTNEIDHIPSEAVLLDVRSLEEYQTGSIEGSIWIPLSEITDSKKVTETLGDTAQPIVVYCASGGRAVKAKSQLKKMGYEKVYNGGGIENVSKLKDKTSRTP